MASKQTKVIKVGVQFEAATNSYANMVKELQTAFKNINLDSTVGKQLNRMVNSMGEKLQQARTIISGGVGSDITSKEMNKFLSLLESMNTLANRFQYTMNNLSVDSLNLDAGEIAKLKQARAEVTKLAIQIENLQNGTATIGTLFKGDAKGSAALKGANAGIKDSATLSEALSAAKQKYADLGAEATKAAVALEEANKSLAAAKQRVAELQNQTKEDAGKQAVAAALNAPLTADNAKLKLATAMSKQPAGSSDEKALGVMSGIFNQYFRKNENGTTSNNLRAGGKEALSLYLEQLGLSDTQIKSIVENAKDRYVRLQTELAKAFENQDLTKAMTKYAADSERSLTKEGQQAWAEQMAEAKAKETAAQREVGQRTNAQTAITQSSVAVQQAIALLEARIANQDQEIAELRAQLEDKIAVEANVESDIKDRHPLPNNDYSGQSRDVSNAARVEAEAEKERLRLQAEAEERANQAAQETQNFQNRLQTSLKQWMGFSQVVNIVRNGIRSAVRDIENLDKAMTNMAVVTDMSISDLWGKISEYMSVAQQYGVTTQGVYEVMQLYAQQGLGLADAMQMTTETLKMARIAGMNYAEAADAMTVAVRGFRMEMSEAQRVTDVYSEVAAMLEMVA